MTPDPDGDGDDHGDIFQLQERPTCSNDLWAAGLPWAGQSGPQTTYMGIVEAVVLGWYRFFVLYSVVSACKAPIM